MKNKKTDKEKKVIPKKTKKTSRKLLSCLTVMFLVSIMLSAPLLWGSQEVDAINGKPRVVTRNSITFGEDTVILKGSLRNAGGAKICLVWFEWGPTKNYGHTTRPKIMTEEDIFRVNILSNDLSNGQIYHYRAVGFNSAGQSYGLDKTFII